MPPELEARHRALFAAGDWDGLLQFLADTSRLHVVRERSSPEVARSWRRLHSETGRSPVDTYRSVLDAPLRDLDAATAVAFLLEDLDYKREAHAIWCELTAHYRRQGSRAELARALNSLGYLSRSRGELEAAREAHREQQAICRDLNDQPGLAMGLGNEALVLKRQGNQDAALACNWDALEVCGELEEAAGIRAGLLINRGSLLEETGDPKAALELYETGAQLARRLGRWNEVRIALGNLVGVCEAGGDTERTLQALREHAEVLRRFEYREELAENLEDQVRILVEHKRHAEALAPLDEFEKLYRDLQPEDVTAKVFWSTLTRIAIAVAARDWQVVLDHARHFERLSREEENAEALRHALDTQASALAIIGDLEGAALARREEEAVCRELGDEKNLLACLAGRARLEDKLGHDAIALELYDEVERLCRKKGFHRVLKTVGESRASIVTRRQVRVFISSPFRDMFEERDQLVKVTFPALRRLCEARGVVLHEVDLRWGISDENQAEVLSLCLREIDQCRPYFIGILGERYGSPIELGQALLEREPWLRSHQGCSVTEVEMLYGPLRSEREARRALFYFRHADHLTEDGGKVDDADPSADARLASLKDRIRACGALVREGYRSSEQLGEWLAADFERLIDEAFPIGQKYDAVATANAHFAALRRRHWVGRQSESALLDQLLAESPAVVVTGSPGIGTSAFLANWAASWRARHPRTLAIEHYVGAHPGATSLEGSCSALCRAIASARGWPAPVADTDCSWYDLLLEHLAESATDGPVLLVIDAVDAVTGPGDDGDADWLVTDLPAGVSIVASAREEGARLLSQRSWPVLRIPELPVLDRLAIVDQYLGSYGKRLSDESASQIALSSATGSPGYLTLLLEELRLHGSHETLGKALEELLEARDTLSLCHALFARCERDFDDPDGMGLCATVLGLLGVARAGLSDAEICELAGGPGNPLPQRRWSMLKLALQRLLVDREGLVGLAQRDTVTAARQRYLSSASREQELRRRIATYFLGRPPSERAAVELPFQLQKLRGWEELAHWLGRPDAFAVCWRVAPGDVCRSWLAIQQSSDLRAAAACAGLPLSQVPEAIDLLRQIGDWEGAIALARQARRKAGDDDDLHLQLRMLLVIGDLALAAGKSSDAEEAFHEAEVVAVDLGELRLSLRALRGEKQAIHEQIGKARGAPDRDRLGRRHRAIVTKIFRMVDGATDENLRIEETVNWLDDAVPAIGWESMEWVTKGLVDTLAPKDSLPRMRFLRLAAERQLASQKQLLDARTKEIELAAQSLRHSRHRHLALRCEITAAKATGDTLRMSRALAALQQHAAAQADPSARARVLGELADLAEGEEKVRWLEKQRRLLEQMGRKVELVRNLWAQATVYWPGLGDRRSAMAQVARIAKGGSVLPTARERIELRAYRARLRFGIGDPQLRRLVLPLPWLVGPIALWVGWQIASLLGVWLVRLPVAGFYVALVVGTLFFVVFMLLAITALGAWAAIRKRIRRARTSGEEPVPSRAVPEGREGSEPGITAADVGLKLPAILLAAIAWLTRVNRQMVRLRRIESSLGLRRPLASLLWCLLVLPMGVWLTLLCFRLTGWGLIALSPLGCGGQFLALDALVGIYHALRHRRRPVAVRFGPGFPVRAALQIAMIRLKRRLFRRRTSRARKVARGSRPGEELARRP